MSDHPTGPLAAMIRDVLLASPHPEAERAVTLFDHWREADTITRLLRDLRDRALHDSLALQRVPAPHTTSILLEDFRA